MKVKLKKAMRNSSIAKWKIKKKREKFIFRKELMLNLPYRIAYITARGIKSDFVTRVFAPALQIDEDPVTGSAHCALVPFWSTKLGKTELFARQLSERGGSLWCRYLGDRVEMGGYAVTFLVGEIWWNKME